MADSYTLLSLTPNEQALALTLPASASGSPQVDVTYSELRVLVLELRNLLRNEGVAAGDIVAMSLVNSLEFVVGFLATGAARAISAPLNPAYSVSEFNFYLEDTKPRVVLLPRDSSKTAPLALESARKCNVNALELWIQAGRPYVKLVFEAIKSGKTVKQSLDNEPPHGDDVALVLHTSGTTGRPKSVPLTHANLLRTTTNIIHTYKLTPKDRSYLVMPLFHVHGLLCGLLSPLASRGSVVIRPKFAASRFWSDFITTKCNCANYTPNTVINPLPSTVPKIRFIRSCSSALAPATLERLEKAFGAPVLEAYAMTEASHQMCSNTFECRIPGTVGVGVGVEVSVRDESGKQVKRGQIGEICVRGPNVTKGYWNNEKANKESFWEGRWFRTGDQGLILPEPSAPHLKLTGRIKELINRGGEKIAPAEVDAALLSVPGIHEAVTFGVPDQKYGEVVWAAVVLDSGDKGTGKEEGERIKRVLQGKISKFKIPERIVITQSIPKTATGKVQRRHVRDAFMKSVETKAKLPNLALTAVLITVLNSALRTTEPRMQPQTAAHDLEEGIYYLRQVIPNRNMGVGGMYATRNEFGEQIQMAALVPSTFNDRDWKIEHAGNNTFYIENAQKNDASVLLDQPREFTIQPVGDGVAFGENVYIIRPYPAGEQIGMDVCVGVEERGVVIKAVPADAPLEARPAWYFSRRHDLEDAS
ncbi:ligase [Rhizoctonia solani]|uniref:Ligase n=1 Tax=Rhizoctonia solani TaxID=456999 RepID=A0A8H7IN25_9AGAM|nr:ligase [Rhizoctonia solani]